MSTSIVYTLGTLRERSCCYLIFCCWRSCFVEHCSLITTAPQAMPVAVPGYVAVLWVALLMPLSVCVQPSQCRVMSCFIGHKRLSAPSPDRQHQRRSCNASGPLCPCTLLGTWWQLSPAAVRYLITAGMGAVGNSGITISSLCNEAQILLGFVVYH